MLFIVVMHLASRQVVYRHATETEERNVLNEHNKVKKNQTGRRQTSWLYNGYILGTIENKSS